MAKNRPQVAVDAPNEMELLDEIDQASGLLASAAGAFSDLGAILESIQAALPKGSLPSRLAQAGINMCEGLESDFTNYSLDFCKDTEQYSRALGLDEFRHFSNTEQSSSVRQ